MKPYVIVRMSKLKCKLNGFSRCKELERVHTHVMDFYNMNDDLEVIQSFRTSFRRDQKQSQTTWVHVHRD